MSAEQNKALIRRLVEEALNRGRVAEVQVLWDRLGAFQQLGVLPSQEDLFAQSRPMPATA